jgi:hypothetical protein
VLTEHAFRTRHPGSRPPARGTPRYNAVRSELALSLPPPRPIPSGPGTPCTPPLDACDLGPLEPTTCLWQRPEPPPSRRPTMPLSPCGRTAPSAGPQPRCHCGH